ncbi:MAG: glycosyltransferase [Deltaproteobacteria bacterium]|jgi:glycosyltransferase involved in cell wall biosynthesis|nr:glycosyltransferase [Deltaproteobacteria bacterium]
MNYLFLHHNYPAQFRFTAAALAGHPENRVVFLTEHQRGDVTLTGVRQGIVPVPQPKSTDNQAEYETLLTLRRGEAFGNAMLELRRQGFTPDIVFDHCGWGCSLFVKDIFPQARRVSYFEWYFNKLYPQDLSAGNRELSPALFAPQRLRNQCQLDALVDCDMAICPTEWQKSQYPAELQPKIRVLHDGIDPAFFSPAAEGEPLLQETRDSGLFGVTELVTYVARGFEPSRGFPEFFRGLPAVLQARPDCHVIIAGADRHVYDAPRPDRRTWLQAMRAEAAVDESRVHILGFQPYPRYKKLLQSSSLHVYLTTPYVLSWSLLEAMSCGCLVLASDTPPVREAVRDGLNGFLTPFPDVQALSAGIIELLETRENLNHVRLAARQSVLDNYNVNTLLPRQLQLIHGAAL